MSESNEKSLKRLDAAIEIGSQFSHANDLFQQMIDEADQKEALLAERAAIEADIEEGTVASLLRAKARLNQAIDESIETLLKNE